MRKLLALSISIISVVLTGIVSADMASSPSTIVLVPARYRLVEFAFDVARFHNVALISYQNDAVKPTELLLHLWNGREWMHVTTENYRSGSFLLGAPRHVVVIGSEGMVPDVLTAAPEWCSRVERITALDISTLVNTFGKLLNFNDSEWMWFSDKYDLTIADLNADRRHYGRWGTPEEEKAREASYRAAKQAAKAKGQSTLYVKPAPEAAMEASDDAKATPVKILPEPVKIESVPEVVPVPAPAPAPVPAPEPASVEPIKPVSAEPAKPAPAPALVAKPAPVPVPVKPVVSTPAVVLPQDK